jgi:hypothetical protein
MAVANLKANAVATLFGDGTAGDSVNLSQNLTATLLGEPTSSSDTTDPILQALESVESNAAAAASGTNSTTATSSAALTNSFQTEVGSLFSYLG